MRHAYLCGYEGQPCDSDGYDLSNDYSEPPREQRDNNDFFPFSSCTEFELADFLFHKEQMAGQKISELMDILAAFQEFTDDPDDLGQGPPFANAQDLYDKIDSIDKGDVPWQASAHHFYNMFNNADTDDVLWQAFSVQFKGDIVDETTVPAWKTKSFEVWFCDPLKIAEGQISNKAFACEMDYRPKCVFSRGGRHQYSDFMSGNWAWQQAVHYMAHIN